MKANYLQLLPRDLHEYLLLFLGIDVDVITIICDNGFILNTLCKKDSPFWHKMIKYHITSNTQVRDEITNRSQYINLIKSAIHTYDNESSQIGLMRDILKYDADLLLRDLLIDYPNSLDKIRTHLITALMTNYILERNDRRLRVSYLIYGLHIPIKFLFILLENYDVEAAMILANYIVFHQGFIQDHKTKFEELIKLMLPKIDVEIFLNTLERYYSTYLLDELGLIQYFK